MAKLLMIAGGVVDAGHGHAGAVCAYVVYSLGRGSRIFKVNGPTTGPSVVELPQATTVDMSRFNHELGDELRPTVDRINASGGSSAVTRPDDSWVCDVVKSFLREREGLEI